MDRSEDITNTEVDSVGAEYGGYTPRHVNEFDVREDSESLPEEESPQPPFLDPNLSRGKPRDDVFSLVSIIVCFTVFVIFLIGGAAAPCKFGLCGKIDRSSTSLQTDYIVDIYDFEAPFKFAWGALTVFFLSCAIISVFSFVLCKLGPEDGVMNEIAAYIRKASFSFLFKQLALASFIVVALFILVAVGYSLRAAGCLAFGAITASLVCITTIFAATVGNVRAASVGRQSRYEEITTELRTATIITVASYAFATGGPAFSYLVFRDVRALSGYVIGAVTVALLVRISGGIFYKASNIDRDPTWDGPRASDTVSDSPNVFAANTGTVLGRAVGEALQTFVAFTIAIVSTSILATSFPYFGDNNYAVCVFNHMEVDHICTGFREPRKKLSFAASICRANAFFQGYPSLSVWASNSAFVAVPFIFGFTGVLATIISTSYRSTPANADIDDEDEDLRQRMAPFVRRIRINVAVGAVVTLISGIAVCFGMFGNSSSFFKENSADRDVYKIPALTAENADSRCRPLEATSEAVVEGNNLAGVPLLELTRAPYRTQDSFGETFPRASETAWRLFLCVLLGVVLGTGHGVIHEWVVSIWGSPSRHVAENGEFGASAVLVEGLGVSFLSTFVSFAVVLILIAGCYGLHGGYGVGMACLGMLSIGGPLSVISLHDVIHDSARGIRAIVSRRDGAGRKTDAFETTGKMLSSVWKGILNSGLMVGVVTLLFVVIQETGLTPSTRQLGGSVSIGPSRHVSDVDGASMTDIYTVVATVIGALGPVVFCGALKLGMSRAWHAVICISRKKAETQGDYHGCTETASRGAIVETVLPAVTAILWPVMIGATFGQRALLGMATGVASMSLLVSQAFCVCGGVWESGRGVVGAVHGGRDAGGRWSRAMRGGAGVGRALGECVGPCVMLGAAEVCAVSAAAARLMRADASRWWAGAAVIGVWGLGGVAWAAALNRRYDVMLGGVRDVLRVDRRAVSPFFERGAGMMRARISPDSEMALSAAPRFEFR